MPEGVSSSFFFKRCHSGEKYILQPFKKRLVRKDRHLDSLIIQSYTTIKLNWKAIEISLLFFIYEDKKIRIRAPK